MTSLGYYDILLPLILLITIILAVIVIMTLLILGSTPDCDSWEYKLPFQSCWSWSNIK